MNWLIPSLITIVLWGVWALMVKIATSFVDWKQYLVISGLGSIATIFFLYLYFRPEIRVHQVGFYYSFFTGILITVSFITFYLALASGKASIVVPLTALYPALTIVLSFLIFQERISLVQSLGVILALVSIVLISL